MELSNKKEQVIDFEKVQKKQYNIGLSVLKMLMCFEVVLIHFWTDTSHSKILSPFLVLTSYAVPVFMLISFMLMEKHIISRKKQYIKSRIWRLVWPQIGWTIIYFIIYKLFEFCFDVNLINGISDLFWRIFTGHSPQLNASMWYQTVLIILNILFFLIFSIFPEKKSVIYIYVFMFFALILEYTGMNYSLFSSFRYELKYPLGKICEMIPYAVIGFSLAYFEIHKKLEKHKFFAIFGSIVITGILLVTSILPKAEGFGYAGLQGIIISVLIVIVALLFPIEQFPEFLKKIFAFVSKYTLGIYCMHRLVGTFITIIFEKIGFEVGSFLMCLLIYVLCFFISASIARIPTKMCKQLVE